ncbi:MAG: hypothetical protein KVP17_000083 [Porospora cf. gigantea B]|uniref:uncharacterized protein n=1 Tax=Porospora cf. gigantea B TaxID=2853592 RepID=UPI003571D4D5|nr:MAG: hypothetical protein KVP17_000083 [Porospora cf. gigantea B]
MASFADDFPEEYEDEDDQPQLEAAVPTGVKRMTGKSVDQKERVILKLRACLVCRVIMSEEQFFESGCPNCQFLQLDGNRHAIWECTTPNFSGMVALLKPEGSWVARYIQLGGDGALVAGCYAVSVIGELPEAIRDQVQSYQYAA